MRTQPRVESVISDRLLAFILSSPYLREAILPEGPLTSPYEILSYRSTLVLHDSQGKRATFKRIQKIRFLQHGVSAILDHAWGRGVVLAGYRNSAGTLGDSLRDQGVRHLVIELDRARSRGEVLKFKVEREAVGAFTSDEGILETTIDHPVRRLTPSIVFPKSRPVRVAEFLSDGETVHLPVEIRRDGSTKVTVNIKRPTAHTSYILRWRW